MSVKRGFTARAVAVVAGAAIGGAAMMGSAGVANAAQLEYLSVCNQGNGSFTAQARAGGKSTFVATRGNCTRMLVEDNSRFTVTVINSGGQRRDVFTGRTFSKQVGPTKVSVRGSFANATVGVSVG
ncbi:hypothetical protein [Amycolatopsis sp. PS_44_ISF1]|uniref:hypothetical protein n=1 Tax=Amycolatopsis sp. PS_44_ISF1 TaxID=2974917 RepID=UPI0028DD92D1|nr:hypothetical protein [Amycolatopsis sp. PS_44_ISF1]MDT8911652.1 hypothetical protein [Amycolatopsis sp. PS_44_ISF1]